MVAQGAEALERMPGHEHLQRFVEQARRRGLLQQRRQLGERRGGGGVDVEVQLGGQARGAQHAHRVLAVARLRVADQAQHPVLQVLHATDVVEHAEIGDVVVHRVDAEVAAHRVFLDAAPDVVAHDPPIDDVAIAVAGLARAAEGGHLDDLAAEHHVRQTEPAADQAAVAEQLAHLLRSRVGGDVEVLGLAPEQQVAHRPADQQRAEAGFVQSVEHAQGGLADVTAGDAVLVPRNDMRAVDGVGRYFVIQAVGFLEAPWALPEGTFPLYYRASRHCAPFV